MTNTKYPENNTKSKASFLRLFGYAKYALRPLIGGLLLTILTVSYTHLYLATDTERQPDNGKHFRSQRAYCSSFVD